MIKNINMRINVILLNNVFLIIYLKMKQIKYVMIVAKIMSIQEYTDIKMYAILQEIYLVEIYF